MWNLPIQSYMAILYCLYKVKLVGGDEVIGYIMFMFWTKSNAIFNWYINNFIID